MAIIRISEGEPYALRLHMRRALEIAREKTGGEALSYGLFDEDFCVTRAEADPERWGDVVLGRKDTPASRATYTGLITHPDLVTYFQAASPLEEISMLNIGSRPSRRFGANSLKDLRAIPWVFAWAQNRHLITGWYGVGSALKSFLEVRGPKGEKLLATMFAESRVFRLIIDEVEKALTVVDLEIAKDYASLVSDQTVRETILAMIEKELALTAQMVLKVSGSAFPAERFPQFRASLAERLPTINEVNREQVELLRRFRASDNDQEREAFKSALLLSINTVAAGLGATG
jgi:phosphoenolpyruvate carboxylase